MVEVISIEQVGQPAPNIIDVAFDFFIHLWWLWLLIILILVGIAYLVYRIIKYLDEQKDIFHQLYKQRIKHCIQHRDSRRFRAYFSVSKNNPVKVFYKDSNGNIITKRIGHYKGHFYSADGSLNIGFNRWKKLLFFPITDILVVNKVKQRTVYKGKDSKGKDVIGKIEIPINIDHWNDDEILIEAYGIQKVGHFYTPVLKDKDGQIIDTSLHTWQGLQDSVNTGELLYDTFNLWQQITKKGMDMNPQIRYLQKTADSSGTIEEETQK